MLEVLKQEETPPQIASRHGVHPNLLRKWKAQALDGLADLFTDDEDKGQRALESDHQRRLAARPLQLRVPDRWRLRCPLRSTWRYPRANTRVNHLP